MKIENVLMVDDDPTIRRVAELSLSRVGKWKVVLADSGSNAIEMLQKTRPDVILLDVMMPGMDGPTTLELIKANDLLEGVPVIFMTARVQAGEVAQYFSIGAAGVIYKPFDPIKLPREIEAIVEKLNGPCATVL